MQKTPTLPDAVRRSLDAQLEPEESVLWIGRPSPRRYAKARADSSPVFCALWTAAWTVLLLIQANSPGVDVSWGLYLVPALGIAGLIRPLVVQHHARSLFYVVTNKRALILENVRNVGVTSFYPRDIVGFTCLQSKGGYGDLVLRAEPYTDAEGDSRIANYGFFGIADPKRLEALVRPLVPSSEEKLETKAAPTFNFPVSVAEWKRGFRLPQR